MSAMRPDMDAGPIWRKWSESKGVDEDDPDCARPMSDWPANASVSAAHAATKRECFMVGAIVYEAVIRAVRVFRGSNWPVPWDIHDERAGDAVVPRLPLGIP